MLSDRWVQNFSVSDKDVDYLMNLMLEREMPMTTEELALVLIEKALEKQRAVLEKQYKDAEIYQPANKYKVGERLIFTAMNYSIGTVTSIRAGDNDDYGEFKVIAVEFADESHNSGDHVREFAAQLTQSHKLSDLTDDNPIDTHDSVNPPDILKSARHQILKPVHDSLMKHDALARVAGYWFLHELVLDTDIGTLHLAEAVLDMASGGPLATKEIIEQIGGLGDAPMELQLFSLNLALNGDERFDEVGTAGHVAWYLTRLEPAMVREVPKMLEYKVIEYNDDLLSDEMFTLETEMDDEHTPIDFEGRLKRATTTLIYPHRRAGTLPLSAKNRAIFPTARTPRIHVELIDTSDGERYDSWVVHEHQYVYGLQDYYSKHRLPVGCYISVERGDNPAQILISYEAYKPRTEWIRILSPYKEQIIFENMRRAIGAEFDDLIIIGVDDLEAVDKLAKAYASKSLAAILRDFISALSKFSPQGTVHAVTLYSAVNVIRRCAPGPIFATLSANPDFEDVGHHYWALRD